MRIIQAMSNERVLRGEVIVPASIDDVWDAWTTREGLLAFFGRDCNVEARPGGPFEIFFLLDNPPGMRGSDGMHYVAVQPKRMLSFTWNFPPSIPELRNENQQTLVVLRFAETENGGTRVTLAQYGWGEGGAWDRGFDYFDVAWNDQVLPALRERFERAGTEQTGEG